MRFYHKHIFIFILLLSSLLVFYSLYLDHATIDFKENIIESGKLISVKNGEFNIWCIFTKVLRHRTIKDKFQSMLSSLLNSTSAVITLNLITDGASRFVAKDVISTIKNVTGKDLKVSFHDVNAIANKIENTVSMMRKYFSSQPGAYYSDSLFFVSLVLHKIVPDQKKVILIDVDTHIRSDVTELFNEFDSFTNESLIGAAPELSPVYHHILYRYRQKNKKTKLGSPYLEGGFPGVNSGVLALHLDRLRASKLYEYLLSEESIKKLTTKYIFKGHLGDQDFYTLIGLEHREIIHMLDCGWNRQLCTWWKHHGYAESFDKFYNCSSNVKIYHGNCDTNIPF